MSEESEKTVSQIGSSGAEWALSAAGRETAEAYLKEQIRLARLQADDLEREDDVRHWSLRVHHISDVMKLVFEFAVAVVLLALVAVVAGVVWSAAHENGVVIEAFKVPPDMAQRGLSGDVVASQLLDRLKYMQSITDSARAPSTYGSNFGNDIKVEIPDTGISISEAYRYLAGWLGHQTHITGEIFRTDSGIALTVRTSDSSGARFDGTENGLQKLVARAAENIFGQTQPFRYSVFLLEHDRYDEADRALGNLALNGPASERPWAYAIWMDVPLSKDDLKDSLDRARQAAALGPENLLAQDNAATDEASAGHDEQELRYAAASNSAYRSGGGGQVTANAATVMALEADAAIGEELGDFKTALSQYDGVQNKPDFVGSRWSAHYMLAVDAAKMHDVEASRFYLGEYTDRELFHLASLGSGWNMINFDIPQFQQFAALGDWQSARKDLEDTLATADARDIGERIVVRHQAWPWLALAQANTGDAKAAFALIAKTPLDCYLCLRMRGRIDQSFGNFAGAAYWYSRAISAAPSVPFAYADWGTMLMRESDLDGAIAKFALANLKGPHFADPLEMWGEALTAENRSDLALAKFAEAEKYAPNWGRLHLKWGEALFWAGKSSDAKAQFARASQLDLTPSEKSELERSKENHG